jgi:hypothetical protein
MRDVLHPPGGLGAAAQGACWSWPATEEEGSDGRRGGGEDGRRPPDTVTRTGRGGEWEGSGGGEVGMGRERGCLLGFWAVDGLLGWVRRPAH